MLFALIFFLFISIPNANCFLGHFVLQILNVIAPTNEMLMDELNLIYFAPKW